MLRSKVFALLCFSILVHQSRGQSCPRAADIAPCECVWDSKTYLAKTTCNNIVDLNIMNKVFRESLDQPLSHVQLHEAHLSYFPAFALKKKKIRHLEINRSLMLGLFDRIPEENHKLEKITVYLTKILRRIDWRMFKNLRTLGDLQIFGTQMGRIGQEFRDNVPTTIDYLNLGRTKGAWLEDRVFERLTRASHLQVSGGKIRVLKRSMFPKENVLTTLAFNDNRITHLSDDIFSGMSKLRVLYLDGNRFTTLPEHIFRPVFERSVMMTFEGNNFICDCGIRWIVLLGNKGRGLDAKCSVPPSLKGKPLQKIPAHELDYCRHT